VGDSQGAIPPASRPQTKVEPSSLLVNVKLAEALPLMIGGPELIVVFGGMVSTVQR
jgi:hypothetical protein